MRLTAEIRVTSHGEFQRLQRGAERVEEQAEECGGVDAEGGDREALGEAEDGGVGRVAFDLTLLDGEVSTGGVELGAVTEPGDHVQRAEGGGCEGSLFVGELVVDLL